MVAITTSLATMPVASDPVACQLPKPSGAKSGAMAADAAPKMLSLDVDIGERTAVALDRDGQQKPEDHADGKNERPRVVDKGRGALPHLTPDVAQRGQSIGRQFQQKGACSSVLSSVFFSSSPTTTATAMPSRYMAKIASPGIARKEDGGKENVDRQARHCNS